MRSKQNSGKEEKQGAGGGEGKDSKRIHPVGKKIE